MNQTKHSWALVVTVGALLSAGCPGDEEIPNDTEIDESSSSSSSSSSSTTTPTTTDPNPTTESPTTESPTTESPTTESPTTESPMTTGTTNPVDTDTGTSTGDTTTTTTDTDIDTDTDTDTTTGEAATGQSISQTVNSGAIMQGSGFKLIMTLGQPTQNQGTYTSSKFRLQGGLIGANGSPP